MPSELDLYEPLEVIGNGSFGIIRKVRRKADGEILARKEINYGRMSERDKKFLVGEVNILKDLYHENIVRYIDRFVDSNAGILYIVMEYCGGGDLATIIKQCTRLNRPLPEDTVWSYFYQLLLALQYCHCPITKSDNSSGEVSKRQQILHRDLKPENIFLSANGTLKLGDFGLSKALGQTSFAKTYVGTPFYMSPELVQEKSYDTKSDIWALGCIIYELCVGQCPFSEARSHNELTMMIRNGRIPPLPKGYSSSLNQIIKSMLNLNPAMRPSAQQLLLHERIDFARKVSETEKMLATVKAHKSTVLAKERELQALSNELAQRESVISSMLGQKDAEIERLAALIAESDERVRKAVAVREEELRVAVMQREEEVRTAMAAREQEILEAVRRREGEINQAWDKREEELRNELSEAIKWVETRQQEITVETERLENVRADLEKEAEKLQNIKGRKEKTPFEEVKNLLAPLSRLAHHEAREYGSTPRRTPLHAAITPTNSGDLQALRGFDTPVTRVTESASLMPGSAMRGIIMTATGEMVRTPAPPVIQVSPSAGAELEKIIMESPRVGLNFRKIFDFESDAESEEESTDGDAEDECTKQLTTSSRSISSSSSSGSERGEENVEMTPSKSSKVRSRSSKESIPSVPVGKHSSVRARTYATPDVKSSTTKTQLPPTRLRKPSIRTSTGRPVLPKSASVPTVNSVTSIATGTTTTISIEAPSQRETAQSARQNITGPPGATSKISSGPTTSLPLTPHYNRADEENLPSPFLRRAEREKASTTGTGTRTGNNATVSGATGGRRKSNSNALRVMATVNSANSMNNIADGSPLLSATADDAAVKAS